MVSHQSRMEFSADIAYNICSLLDNETLEKIYVLGLVPSLDSLFKCNSFWYSRVETLSQLRILFSPSGDWKQTYQLLEAQLAAPSTSFYNREDNVTVLHLLLHLRHRPNGNEIRQAACYGKIKILSFLLEEGSTNPNPDRGEKPLNLACRFGHEECVKLLLADPRVELGDNQIALLLREASSCRIAYKKDSYVRIMKLLLDYQDDSIECSSALETVIRCGDNVEIVRLLLSHPRANLSRIDNGIITASAASRIGIVKLLLDDPRVDPSTQSNQVLMDVIRRCYFEVAELLLEREQVRAELNIGVLEDMLRLYPEAERVIELIRASLDT